MSAGFGEVVTGEEFSSEPNDGARAEAMEAVEPSALACFGELFRGAGFGDEAGFVFEEVIPVGADASAEEPAGEDVSSAAVEGDLEVDQPGFSIRAVENVFAFVGINVGDVAVMDGGEEGGKFFEKLGSELLAAVEVRAGDVLVHKTGTPEEA